MDKDLTAWDIENILKSEGTLEIIEQSDSKCIIKYKGYTYSTIAKEVEETHLKRPIKDIDIILRARTIRKIGFRHLNK